MSDKINGRWNDYFFCKGNTNFEQFWENYLSPSNKKLLFILGKGLDPRMNIGVSKIFNSGDSSGDCLCLKLDEGEKSPSYDYNKIIDDNYEELKELFNGKGTIDTVTIKMHTEDGRLIGSRNVAKSIQYPYLKDYSDIIVDISSLPRIIFIPLIARILSLLERNHSKTNLHITVAENFALDEIIQSDGLHEEAETIHGFSGDLDKQSNLNKRNVWLPILGGNKREKLNKIIDLIRPDEICPILPSPSRNPRRSDDLVIEYVDFFYEYPEVEISNIIYANEQNPFEVYKQIYRTAKQYTNALAPLDGCNIIVSPLSSKLLSVGALLAAIELNLALTEVPVNGYKIMNKQKVNSEYGKETLFELWIYGEPYE